MIHLVALHIGWDFDTGSIQETVFWDFEKGKKLIVRSRIDLWTKSVQNICSRFFGQSLRLTTGSENLDKYQQTSGWYLHYKYKTPKSWQRNSSDYEEQGKGGEGSKEVHLQEASHWTNRNRLSSGHKATTGFVLLQRSVHNTVRDSAVHKTVKVDWAGTLMFIFIKYNFLDWAVTLIRTDAQSRTEEECTKLIEHNTFKELHSSYCTLLNGSVDLSRSSYQHFGFQLKWQHFREATSLRLQGRWFSLVCKCLGKHLASVCKCLENILIALSAGVVSLSV